MVKTTKQSKLDWSIYYIKGKRFPELDYTWEVVRTFQVAKLLIIKYMKGEFYA